jgi:hypothetical protein
MDLRQLLGYFYIVPIAIIVSLVLRAVRVRLESAHRKPISEKRVKKTIKRRKQQLGQEG